MRKALLIIDVNKYYLKDLPKNFTNKIRKHIENSEYDNIAFSVFKNEPESNFARSLNWTKCSSEEDAKLPDDLRGYARKESVFRRSTYSGFTGTNLQEYLKSKNINELTLCGINTDACVLATAFSAFDLGYKVHVNFDLTFSANDLEKYAQAIIRESILPQDKQKQ